MSNREIGASQALRMRVTDLNERMLGARITENELKTFRKVAAVMEDGKGRIDADDLIAASFLVETQELTKPPLESEALQCPSLPA